MEAGDFVLADRGVGRVDGGAEAAGGEDVGSANAGRLMTPHMSSTSGIDRKDERIMATSTLFWRVVPRRVTIRGTGASPMFNPL
jgi:hypothetical protein